MTIEETLCRWAEQRYSLSNVSEVRFEDNYDAGWSDLTPGLGAYTAVLARDGGGEWYEVGREAYTPSLINDILRFVVK